MGTQVTKAANRLPTLVLENMYKILFFFPAYRSNQRQGDSFFAHKTRCSIFEVCGWHEFERYC